MQSIDVLSTWKNNLLSKSFDQIYKTFLTDFQLNDSQQYSWRGIPLVSNCKLLYGFIRVESYRPLLWYFL